MLRFGDGTNVSIEFANGETIDEALSKLRTASTPDAQPSSTDEVERVARAMKPKLFSGASDDRVGPVTRYEREFTRDMARRAIAAMVTKPSEICVCGPRPGGDDLGHDIECPMNPLNTQSGDSL
jgi:hypothetical protein